MYLKNIMRIESVQKTFINSVNFRFNKLRYFLTYPENLQYYPLESVLNRCSNYDIIFIFKPFNNLIDSNSMFKIRMLLIKPAQILIFYTYKIVPNLFDNFKC